MKFKKRYFSIILGIVPLLMNGQDYKMQFQNDICGCMETTAEEKKLGDNPAIYYQLCFQEKLPTYVSDIDAEITATEQREIYAEGQRIRKELKISFISELIKTCDFYYQGIEAQRENIVIGLKKIAENVQYYDIVNQAVAMQPTAKNYINRGQVYFGSEKYGLATSDFQKALEINENDRGAKLMLAWTYEKMHNYTGAIKLLETLNEGNANPDIQVQIEIVTRKMGGKLPIVKPPIKSSDVPSKSPEKKDDLLKLFKLE